MGNITNTQVVTVTIMVTKVGLLKQNSCGDVYTIKVPKDKTKIA